jgi:hypothetical protein
MTVTLVQTIQVLSHSADATGSKTLLRRQSGETPMSIGSISSFVLSPDAASAPTNSAAAQPAPPVANGADTVQLTEAQQVYALYNQGQQASQIATALGLPVAVVNNYLNLTNSG